LFFYLCKGDRVDELESFHEIGGAVKQCTFFFGKKMENKGEEGREGEGRREFYMWCGDH
jgi:hypothetical protein